jgi:hypothetical protein
LLPIDQSDGEAIRQPGPEFFHQIQRQCRPVGTFGVGKPNKRIQADAGQRGDTIMPDQRVEEN